MLLANRVELVPTVLVAIDFMTAVCFAVVLLPVGLVQVFAPFLFSLVIYAGGEYSLLVEARPRLRPGVALACVLLMAIFEVPLLWQDARWLVPMNAVTRILVAAAAGMLLAGIHHGLKSFLLSRSERYVLHLRGDMMAMAESLRRHIGRSGYPARVEADGERAQPTDRLVAEVLFPRAKEQRLVKAFFDPARFCDVVLRAFPPAMLEHRRGYVSWDAAGRLAYDAVKRVFDVLAAALLMAAGLPLILLATLGTVMSDGRPVLFRQVRVGRLGDRFSLLKFRTLREHSAAVVTPNDNIEQRVFPFGAFLRQTRLDELPQLINVLKGDMSLIGPRPEMGYFHDRWTGVIPFYEKRLLVRPGMSGWAQVRFTHTTDEMDYWDKTAYDLWYIARRGFMLDMRIFLRTTGVILFGFGAR